MLGMGCPGMTVSTTRSFTAHLSLQSVHNLTRRKRLVNACRPRLFVTGITQLERREWARPFTDDRNQKALFIADLLQLKT